MIGQTTSFNLTDSETETSPIYVGHRERRGYFAWVKFTTITSATIQVFHGPTEDTLEHITELDMAVSDTNGNTFDIGTAARFVKFKIVSASPFDADVIVARG